MKVQSSAIESSAVVQPHGSILAAIGVLAFSFSLPATAWALRGFGPWSATGVRGVLAAVLAGSSLILARRQLPERADWPGLVIVALGCVLGFPLLTTLALQTSSTAHSAVLIGALPMATASISAWRTGRRHSRVFWIAAGLGAITIAAFTVAQNHGRPTLGDVYLFGALIVCAAGYAEGGRLSAHLPGWVVIAWGVVLAAPVTAVVTAWALPREGVHLTAAAVTGMLYIAVVSQFLGFVLWYRGMGLIGVPRASQLQLAQPLLTLGWAALLLGEQVPPAAPIAAVVVLTCIVVTQRADG